VLTMQPPKALNQRLDTRRVESRREPMKTMLLATAAVLGIGIGPAYAGDGHGPAAGSLFHPASWRHRPDPNAAGAQRGG
jgi:hypothetical protein